MNTGREISVHEEATERLRLKSDLKQMVKDGSVETLVCKQFYKNLRQVLLAFVWYY